MTTPTTRLGYARSRKGQLAPAESPVSRAKLTIDDLAPEIGPYWAYPATYALRPCSASPRRNLSGLLVCRTYTESAYTRSRYLRDRKSTAPVVNLCRRLVGTEPRNFTHEIVRNCPRCTRLDFDFNLVRQPDTPAIRSADHPIRIEHPSLGDIDQSWSWFLGQRVKVDRPTKGTIHDGKAQTVFG